MKNYFKNFRQILDKQVLNCYYGFNTDSILAVSPLPPPPSECRPRVPSSGPLLFSADKSAASPLTTSQT
jgi:hypothetical protein